MNKTTKINELDTLAAGFAADPAIPLVVVEAMRKWGYAFYRQYNPDIRVFQLRPRHLHVAGWRLYIGGYRHYQFGKAIQSDQTTITVGQFSYWGIDYETAVLNRLSDIPVIALPEVPGWVEFNETLTRYLEDES